MRASRRHFHWARWLGATLAATMLALACSGCAVKAYQREHLADPIMRFEAQAKRDARTTKWLESREGSTGGTGGAGGGCACN